MVVRFGMLGLDSKPGLASPPTVKHKRSLPIAANGVWLFPEMPVESKSDFNYRKWSLDWR
jgi:hypothetical protein